MIRTPPSPPAASPAAHTQDQAQAQAEFADERVNVVAVIWPLLLTVFFCQIPIQASAIFVGALANDFRVDVTVIGGLRGVGGIAALVVGLLVAPLMDRMPRAWTVCIGMAL